MDIEIGVVPNDEGEDNGQGEDEKQQQAQQQNKDTENWDQTLLFLILITMQWNVTIVIVNTVCYIPKSKEAANSVPPQDSIKIQFDLFYFWYFRRHNRFMLPFIDFHNRTRIFYSPTVMKWTERLSYHVSTAWVFLFYWADQSITIGAGEKRDIPRNQWAKSILVKLSVESDTMLKTDKIQIHRILLGS